MENKLNVPSILKAATPEVQSFAERSLEHCCHWFGLPDDLYWTTTVVLGPSSFCRRIRFLKRYFLVISRECGNSAQKCSDIAHEIYHRVTYLNAFLRRTPLIDEALAFLTSQRILVESGFENYADIVSDYYLQNYESIEVATSLPVRLKWHWIPKKQYPENFAFHAFRLGMAMDSFLTWEQLCSLTRSHSLTEWLESLSEANRFCIHHILLKPEAEILPAFSILKEKREMNNQQQACILIDLGYALYLLGQMQKYYSWRSGEHLTLFL